MYKLKNYIAWNTHAAPLAVFRVLFGLMMFISIIRFWSLGWINKLYIEPSYSFSYYGFEFIQPLGEFTYLVFLVCGLAALGVMLGFRYKVSILIFFLSFTYIELMDKTTYLNHYYFISLLSFLMLFLPAHVHFSLDARKNKSLRSDLVPRWSIDAIKLLICIVYFYAGLAKLNSEWLIHAMPLKIWLPSVYDLPILGSFMHKTWLIYLFSWSGAIFDLAIPFLLWNRKTRVYAFAMVIVFHVLTRILFPIGMFPYIMIVNALIFFNASLHQKAIRIFQRLFSKKIQSKELTNVPGTPAYIPVILSLFFLFNIIFPFRHLLYPGELFWTEEGYRFSWRVMLMEKAGYAQFKVVDGETGQSFMIENNRFLTPFQEKQMATQPDFILEYAHFLKERYEDEGMKQVEIYVESYVALNGRRSRQYINPEVNLAEIERSLKHKTWIIPFDGKIKGI